MSDADLVADPGHDLPRIYLASKLTGLTETRRARLEVECEVIQRAAVSAAVDDEPPWEVVVYTPLMHTAPWRNSDTPLAIWRRNLEHVVCSADALVIHGADSASFGVGNEGTLAFERGIPILYVHHGATDPVSRQTLGMASDALDMTVASFASVDHLEAIVADWIRARRNLLQAGPTLRASSAHLWEPLQQEMAAAWSIVKRDSSAEDIVQACFLSGMGAGEIDNCTSSPLLLGHLPTAKLLRLGNALRVSIAPFLGPMRHAPALTEDEENELVEWQRANRFGEAFRNQLGIRARIWKFEEQQRDRGFVESGMPRRESERFDFTSRPGWEAFYLAWRDGRI